MKTKELTIRLESWHVMILSLVLGLTITAVVSWWIILLNFFMMFFLPHIASKLKYNDNVQLGLGFLGLLFGQFIFVWIVLNKLVNKTSFENETRILIKSQLPSEKYMVKPKAPKTALENLASIPKAVRSIIKTVLVIGLIVGVIFLLLIGYALYKSYMNNTEIPTTVSTNTQYTSTTQNMQISNIEQMKKSIVFIRHDVTGCCDSYNQISSLLGGSGSGVIWFEDENNTVYVLTSRHVVDCVFAQTCSYPTNDTITIRTQDGNFYNPNGILFFPSNLDLVLLTFINSSASKPVLTQNKTGTNISLDKIREFISNITVVGNDVVAIGYPSAGLESPEPILQFSVTEGKITNTYNLLTYQGLSFTAIESDALTGHGSSGGGLFDKTYGMLIGIITWGDTAQQKTIAISTSVIYSNNTLNTLWSCPSGTYSTVYQGGCCSYGTIAVTGGKCYQPCGRPSQYCTQGTCCNNQCVSCPSGYYLAVDCNCYRNQ